MGLRYGFKSEANWWSREMRRELLLRPFDPLCPWRLCDHLHIPIYELSAFAKQHPKEVAFLGSTQGKKDFSAVTLKSGAMRVIIHNDAHDRKRQASNLSHEIAHALLMHPTHQLPDGGGGRHYDKDIEDEASWLGPALLISDEAALFIARQMTVEEASDHFGASKDVVQMRLNVSGAYRRVA